MQNNFKNTDIGLIPEDWNLILLDNEAYFKTINGLWKGKKSPFKKVTVIRNTNFTELGLIDYSDVAVLDVEENQYNSRKLFYGDIIIERSGGGPTQPVGRVVFFDRIDGEFSFSNFTSCLRTVNQKEFLPIYVFYSLLNFYLSGRTNSLQARTTGIRNLNFTSYKEKVGIPQISLPEQKKIAHVLSKIQQAIETQVKTIKTTQELKKTLMLKLFTEGLNGEPQKQTEIGPIPESWEVVPVSELFETQQGKQLSALTRIGNNQKSFLRTSNVYWGRLDLSKLDEMNFTNIEENKLNLRINDILLCEGGEIGRCLVLDRDLQNVYYQNHLHRMRKKKDCINPYFFTYWMYYSFIISPKYFGIGNVTTIPNLSSSRLNSMHIPMPKIEEQNQIVRYFYSLDEKTQLEKTHRNELKSLFYTMLNQLMTGQIRVKDIEFKIEKTAEAVH